MRRQPREHQVKALRAAKRRRTLPLWWEMRLGKTLVAIRWADSRPRARRRLAVCPKAVVPVWARELKQEGHEPVCLLGSTQDKLKAIERNPHASWYVTNYEGLTIPGGKRAKPSPVAELPWDVVVLDESTKIKNPTAKVTKVALKHLGKAPFRACLSGLPDPEGPMDFVCQLLFLYGTLMKASNFYEWRVRHAQQAGFDWVIKNPSHDDLMRIVREDGFVLTRKDAGLHVPKVHERRYVSLPRKVRRTYTRVERRWEVDDKLYTSNALVALTWMSQLIGGRFPYDPDVHHEAKIKELADLLEGDLRGQQVVVWFRFNEEIEAVEGELDWRGIDTVKVHGGVDERTDNLKAFKQLGVSVLLAQAKAIPFGEDLSCADAEVYFSNYWDYELRAQTEDRLVHPDKKEPVLVMDLAATDTVDDDCLNVLMEKGVEAKQFQRKIKGIIRSRRDERT